MPAGVRKVHVVLHQVLQAAVPRHIPVNPATKPAGQRKGKLPKIKRYRACFLTPEEADMIIRAAAPQIIDLIRTALCTGLRLGELLGLRVQDADLDAKTPLIRVEQSLKRDGTFGAPKSEKSERSITISRSLVEILRAVRSSHPAPRPPARRRETSDGTLRTPLRTGSVPAATTANANAPTPAAELHPPRREPAVDTFSMPS